MSPAPSLDALYSSRAAAGAQLGRQLYGRTSPPMMVVGVTPSGVEIAASIARSLGCPFDVVVAADVQMRGTGIIGAVAEDADAVLDPEFEARFSAIDVLEEALSNAHQTVKAERLLFRGQRPLRSVEGRNVVVVDGHVTTPWKLLAAARAIQQGFPSQVVIGTPVSTQGVQERVLLQRLQFVCPTVVVDPGGHPLPFGDYRDPSAERLRSIVVARDAA